MRSKTSVKTGNLGKGLKSNRFADTAPRLVLFAPKTSTIESPARSRRLTVFVSMKKVNETKGYVKPEVEEVDMMPSDVLCTSTLDGSSTNEDGGRGF